ncbi:MAG: hypothetical protein AB8B60_08985 [Sulfitobacter sp.]
MNYTGNLNGPVFEQRLVALTQAKDELLQTDFGDGEISSEEQQILDRVNQKMEQLEAHLERVKAVEAEGGGVQAAEGADPPDTAAAQEGAAEGGNSRGKQNRTKRLKQIRKSLDSLLSEMST